MKIEVLLNNWGSKLGLDLKYFLKGGFWLSLEQFISLLRSLCVSIIVTNFLTKSEFGKFTFFLSMMEIVSVFSLYGINQSIIQSCSRGFDGSYILGLKTKLRFSLLGSLFLFLTAIYFFVVNEAMASVAIIISLLFPLYSLSGLYRSYFLATTKFASITQVNFVFSSLYILTIFLVSFFYKESNVLILINVLANSLLGVYAIYLTRKLRNDETDTNTVNYGKSLTISGIFNKVADHADSIILAGLLGFVDLAIYNVAVLLPNIIKNALEPINNTFLPKLSNQTFSAKNKNLLWKHVLKMLVPTVILITAFLVFLPFLLSWFFPDYKDSSLKYSLIYTLSFITLPISILKSHFIAAKKTTEIYIIRGAYAATILLILPPMIYYFGIWGAIWGRFISRALVFLVIAIAFERSFSKQEKFI